ncbi:MAG TPA: PadR family transcriptional regulator [Gemmatimonadales bacterium]
MTQVDLLQGTLDLLLLKALSWGPMHGYEINRWIRDTTGEALSVEEGALYPALHRLEARGWVASEWGLTEQNRRAKYYQLTKAGKEQCRRQASTWTRYVGVMARVLEARRG